MHRFYYRYTYSIFNLSLRHNNSFLCNILLFISVALNGVQGTHSSYQLYNKLFLRFLTTVLLLSSCVCTYTRKCIYWKGVYWYQYKVYSWIYIYCLLYFPPYLFHSTLTSSSMQIQKYKGKTFPEGEQFKERGSQVNHKVQRKHKGQLQKAFQWEIR